MNREVAVAVGAFADASCPAPRVSVYERQEHPWEVVPDDLEHHDRPSATKACLERLLL